MIEIPSGFTVSEITTQIEVDDLTYKIDKMNRDLATALERRAQLQSTCKHNHVAFAGQEMKCQVCRLGIDK